MMHDVDRRSATDEAATSTGMPVAHRHPVTPPVHVGRTFAVVGALHAVAAALLLVGVGAASWSLLLSCAMFAYGRGVVHAFDFDHVSMIDNSTRKFVAEGRAPASLGLAFSLGHSTVVVLMGVFVVAGSSAVQALLTDGSPATTVLGTVGVSVAGVYLLLVAVANTASLVQTLRVRAAVRRDPDLVVAAEVLQPKGVAARMMTAPLRKVSRPRHVYIIGALFGLGFDTASTIGLLMVTTAVAASGVPVVALLAFPLLFAAGMCLGDSVNGVYILHLYRSAQTDLWRRINYNLVVTGIGVLSAFSVAVIAGASLLSEQAGVGGVVSAVAEVNTEWAGWGLAATFVVAGLVMWGATRRSRRVAPPADACGVSAAGRNVHFDGDKRGSRGRGAV